HWKRAPRRSPPNSAPTDSRLSTKGERTMTGIGYRRGENKVQLADETPATELLRVTRLARELRLTNQMLSMDVDAVNVQAIGGAPAWTTTDGTTVTFGYDMMPPITAVASRVNVAVWLGTNA